jgi:NAD(P)-dependent dehydrogenase (short-subunit alcohol dehydrogenase family)
MKRLLGKKAIITGAATGIGRAIALQLAGEGCDIGMMELDTASGEQTAQAVRALGRQAHVTPCDVRHPDQIATAAKDLLERLGPCDILVNNAGICRFGFILEMDPQDWSEQFRINVDGTFHVTRAIVPQMVARRSGSVINLASWMGKSAVANYGGYCATKFAIVALTQSLACELGPSGVRVNALAPGLIVNTVMRDEAEVYMKARGLPTAADRESNIPLRRAGTPEDIAKVAAFLASDDASYITGEAVNITGGSWNV